MKRKVTPIVFAILIMFTVACNQATGGIQSSLTAEDNIKRVKVISQNTNVRKGCSNDTAVVKTATKDATFDVLNKVADWYAVKLPDNTIGFVPQNQCKPIIADSKKPTITPTTPGTTTNTQPQVPGTQTQAPGTQAPGTKTNNNEVNNTTKLSSQEQEMVKLVNDARAKNNLPALIADIQLSNVARIKAQDMIDNNYFSHNSPKYGSPFDMMKQFGINYVKAGENIAGNQTVAKAHEALMNSPGHRANILSPDYTHIGIGIKSGGPYGSMFSQMFISKPQ